MFRMKILPLLSFFLLLSAAAGEILLDQPAEQFIPIKSVKKFTFPAQKKEKQIVLELEHRIDYPRLSGWTPMLQIRVNGEIAVPNCLQGKKRLLNKPEKVPHRAVKFFPVSDGSSFYTLYSPDFKLALQSFPAPYTAQAYRLELDITDLVDDEEVNTVEFRTGGGILVDFFRKTKVNLKPGVILRNIRITRKDSSSRLIDNSQVKKEFKGKVLLDQPREFAIKTMSGRKFDLPAAEKDKRTVLEFENRIHHPKGGGWNPAMMIAVNGKNISAMISRRLPRLLNKPHLMPHSVYRTFKACDGIKWFCLYSKNYKFLSGAFGQWAPEAYRVAVDISDLVYSDKPNRIEIQFGASWLPNYYRVNQLGCEPALMIRNLKVIQMDEKSPLCVEKKPVFVTMKPAAVPEFSLSGGKDSMRLQISGQTFPIRCSYSVPGKKDPVFHNAVQGTMETPYYTLSRRMVRSKQKVTFFDTFASRSNKLIGIRIVCGTEEKPFDLIRLGGDDSPEKILRKSGKNPSAWVGSSKSGVSFGLIAEDDVFRVQNEQFLERGRVGIRTQTFALSPGEKRTVEWSVYPVASADYFDFVNAVRRDWKVNFPIQGGFAFTIPVQFKMKKGELRQMDRDYGVTFNSTGCFSLNWIGGKYKNYVSTLHGSALFDEFHRGRTRPGVEPEKIPCSPIRAMLKKTSAVVREELKGSSAKMLCYVHSQISTEIDDWQKYPDCIQTKANGEKWHYGSGKSTSHIFIPTPDNAFGKKTFDYMCRVIDELGFDGIYNDEFNHSASRLTYSMWDKVSVELDSNNQVKRKIGFVPLLKLPFSLKVLHEFTVKRKVPFVANFAPETRSELKYRVPRFEETFHSDMPLATQLYTPIQLGDQLSFPMTPEGMMADIRHALSNGLLYYYYVNRTAKPVVVQKMFPFTPIELHSGWLIGKERILTIHSGEYGWHNDDSLSIPEVSDPAGRTLISPNAVFFQTPDGIRCRLRLDKDHCAVLVRIPVTAKLSGNITLEKPVWDQGRFSAVLKGSGTAVITRKGTKPVKFKLKSGSREIRL